MLDEDMAELKEELNAWKKFGNGTLEELQIATKELTKTVRLLSEAHKKIEALKKLCVEQNEIMMKQDHMIGELSGVKMPYEKIKQ